MSEMTENKERLCPACRDEHHTLCRYNSRPVFAGCTCPCRTLPQEQYLKWAETRRK